jgi:hypothetical protein
MQTSTLPELLINMTAEEPEWIYQGYRCEKTIFYELGRLAAGQPEYYGRQIISLSDDRNAEPDLWAIKTLEKLPLSRAEALKLRAENDATWRFWHWLQGFAAQEFTAGHLRQTGESVLWGFYRIESNKFAIDHILTIEADKVELEMKIEDGFERDEASAIYSFFKGRSATVRKDIYTETARKKYKSRGRIIESLDATMSNYARGVLLRSVAERDADSFTD